MMVLGRQYYGWSLTFEHGFWPVVSALILNGIGYICLTLCMSEMSSTLPFSGGIYGFVRAFLGPFSGYIASRFELLLNISMVSISTLVVAAFPTIAGISTIEQEPAWWCLFYGFAMIVILMGGNVFRVWVWLSGSFALVLMLIYIFGSFQSVDYNTWANGDHPFSGSDFMGAFPFTSPVYLGIQYLPLTSGNCADVSNFLCCSSYSVLMLCCSLREMFLLQ